MCIYDHVHASVAIWPKSKLPVAHHCSPPGRLRREHPLYRVPRCPTAHNWRCRITRVIVQSIGDKSQHRVLRAGAESISE